MTPVLTMPSRSVAGPRSMRVKGPRRTHWRADDRPIPRRAPLSLAVALALGSGGLQAATFTVPSAADSGAGSLRQAVLDANAAPGADEITFADNLGTITLTGGQLEITETLTITGPAAGQTIDGGKDGGRIGRIFGVTSANTALTLENLTLTNAKTTAAKVSNNCSGSAGQGGAICTLGGQLTLTNSTVSGNTTTGNYTNGGGVNSYSKSGTSTVTLTSSILAGNVVGGTADDCVMSSGAATGSNNLIGSTAKACGLTNGTNNNLVGSDPLLAALADNGCVTPSGSGGACVQTHALPTGSPAIDAGGTTTLTTDQRGQPRQSGSAVDIGAFELQSFGLTVTGGGSGDGTVTGNGLDCTITAGTPSGTCTATLNEGSAVTATAAEATGSTFSGWTDTTCNGTTNPCAFNLTEAKTITAAFGKSQYALTLTGGGTGTGTVTGNGISCTLTAGVASGTCTATLDHGTNVSLTAAATAGTFGGWSDAGCGTASPCTFEMTAATSLSATFQQTATGGGTTAGGGTTTTTGTTSAGTTGTTTSGTDTETTAGNCRANITCSDTSKLWIHRAYRGYYGRCAECGGFRYWCERLDAEGGGADLSPIIAAFGTSREYTNRFSGLSDVELIHNLYRNMFNREAEPGGLRFYLELLEAYRLEWRDNHDGSDQGATEFGLSHIALDILLGAQGNDVGTLDGKLQACEQF